MSYMNALIIDDDPFSIEIIKNHIENLQNVKVLESYTDSESALKGIKEHKPDLVFLDVEMPGLSGLELLSTIDESPEVIIVSSNQEYALDSFDHGVADFLLKPLDSAERFEKAVKKAQRNFEKAGKSKTDLNGSYFLKVDSMFVRIQPKDIYMLEAYGDYIKVHLKDKYHVIHARMNDMERKLDSDVFSRTHRSYIVNMEKVDNISATSIEINDKIVPVGKTHKAKVFENINLL